jgi:hypothetical protein
MSSIEHCIEQLDAVREAAADPGAAYVIRSRLERLLLSCARVVAQMSACAEPELPQRVLDYPYSTGQAHALAEACNTLHDLAGSICRPSESLDVRWEEGWRRISAALAHLEGVLAASNNAPEAALPLPGEPEVTPSLG